MLPLGRDKKRVPVLTIVDKSVQLRIKELAKAKDMTIAGYVRRILMQHVIRAEVCNNPGEHAIACGCPK